MRLAALSTGLLKRVKPLLPYLPLIVILGCAAYMYFLRLGRNPFMDWDECLYSQYTKEMQTAQHFISNIWNEYIDMQKPPLYTWVLVGLSKMFGLTEFVLRSGSALAGLGLITAVYLFTKRYFSVMTATLAAVFMLTGELVVIYSLRLSTDMFYTLFVFLACWAWIESIRSYKWSYVAGLLFGIGTMFKGIGSIQFMGVLLLTYAFKPQRQILTNYVRMIAVWACVVAPWHVLMYARYGDDFIRVYIFDNIIKRGKYPIEFHLERWWFYFVLLWKELKPWIVLALIFPVVWLHTFFSQKGSLLKKSVHTWALIRKDYIVFLVLLLILLPLASLTRFQTRVSWYALGLYPFIGVFLAVCATKLPRIAPFFILLAGADAAQLIQNEVKPTVHTYVSSPREDIILAARTFPQKELYYLVPFSERQAKEILPATQQIDMTWVYGGNPCAVYYSDKKVEFMYTLDEFKNSAGVEGRLYLAKKEDIGQIQKASTEKKPVVLTENQEYMLFTY